jgi:predicted transcriptional regulator
VKKKMNLSKVESYVLNILESGAAKSDEINKIANLCNLTEIQVMVALQLLTHKKVLSTEDVS